MKTDYLIDDNPRQLQIFEGEPIILLRLTMLVKNVLNVLTVGKM